ncbi:MAG TPA: GntR family transcriptional regulator, partial [Methylomirabilota bacterium]|nr:GntR family transcriptional regulator [Methylomirabilota bacterium]
MRAHSAARDDRVSTTYRRLRELIVGGRLAPGARLIETELAGRLGVSRTPVRSALLRLEQEGYIVSPGGRRARPAVAALTREDAREVFDIVGEVEGLAARRAATLAPRARRRLAARLRRLNTTLLKAAGARRPDPTRFFRLDAEFHACYVHAAAGPRLLALHHGIRPQAERYVRVYVSALVDEMGTSVAEHDAIIRAIASGSAAAAQRAVQTNWRNAALRLGRVITTLGEHG